MKRRSFIQSTGILSLPMLLGGTPVSAISRSRLFNYMDPNSDRVLVLVQLTGGNDGLNTLIPLDQYAALTQVRSNVLIPDQNIVSMTSTNGLHPSFGAMKSLWDNEQLGIIQGVGYPDQNRSHFRSTDIWTTASHSDEFLTTGWLGRYLDTQFPGYPEGYPNEEHPDPFAITLGPIVSETCQGEGSNFSFALSNPEDLKELDPTADGTVDMSCYGTQLSFVREMIRQTNAYTGSVSTAYDKGANQVTYPDTSLGAQLQIVSRLIAGGLKTKIYVVNIGGFDTHANQVVEGDVLTGEHAELLSELSSAIVAFQQDLVALSIDDRVIGMTFSEFGRRIRSNFSFGTDHGSAAPLFLFGSCVQPFVFGDNPQIDTQVDEQEGVAMQYDFRSVYGTILEDWFGIPDSQVRQILFDDYQHIPFLKNCQGSVSTEELSALKIEVKLWPNPASDYVRIGFESRGGRTQIQLYDVLGGLVNTFSDQVIPKGYQEWSLPLHNLSRGNYFLRLTQGTATTTQKLIVMH